MLGLTLIAASTANAADLSVVYYEKDGQMVKADYETASANGGAMFVALKAGYANAVMNGTRLILELSNGKVVDWLANINGDCIPWSQADSLPTVDIPDYTLILGLDGIEVPVEISDFEVLNIY